MNTEQTTPVTVSADALGAFTTAVLERKGMSAEDAAKVSEALLWANLRGVDTHGVTRLAFYAGLIDKGDMNPRAVPACKFDLPGAALLDADRSSGPVAMWLAMQLAIDKARANGIAMVSVRSTTHTGALGFYTQAAARQGCAAIAFSATSPNMIYHGASAAGVATNPLSIAVPRPGSEPVVLDMATGASNMGRILQARRSGEPLDPGLAADRDGNPVTDATQAQLLFPMAGPKGSGLSLMIELLASVMAGNPLVSDWLEQMPASKRHRQNALVIAIDIGRFIAPDALMRETERLAQCIKALRPATEDGEVLLPGERGDGVYRQRSREGIPLPRPLHRELSALGVGLGLPEGSI